MSDAPERIVPSCVEALESYQQADMEGVMVSASRQAIHETIDAYWARVKACEELEAALPEQIEWVKRLADDLNAAEGREARLKAKLEKAVEALEYADRMVRLDLLRMTDFDCEDFSQAVVDTGERINATLSELKGQDDG